jgi:predicted HAD superfamily phosphohydrolase YqeG
VSPAGREVTCTDEPAAGRWSSVAERDLLCPNGPWCTLPAAVAEGRGRVTSGYAGVTRLADVFAEAGKLSVRTMIIDVEPLVASWRSGQEALDRGIARVLGEVRLLPSVRVVVFATNSARRPSAVPACDGLQVRYLESAGKPLRIAPYRDLPQPGAVAGDQLPTDGLLARRLGFTFLHYMPELTGVPLGPELMHRWGDLVRPLLFRLPDRGVTG